MSLTTLPPHTQLQHQLDAHLGKLVVLIFCADWSKNSLLFRDRILQTLPLFGQFDNVIYLLIKAEESQDVLRQFSIQVVPSVIFTDYKKTIIRRFQTEDVSVVLDALVEESENYRCGFEKEKIAWLQKIRNIVKEHSVLVFAQGKQQSTQKDHLIALLNKHGVEFTYRNVLESKFISGWVQVFSNCVGFPQLFVNNKFVGNNATCQELQAKGLFLPLIPSGNLLISPEQTLQTLLATHKILVITQHFTYQSKEVHLFLEKIKEKYNDPTIFNLSINEPLLTFVASKYRNQLPLLFIDGAHIQIPQ